MSDGVWKRQEVDSPCVKICQIHPAARICIGCYRTIEEIGRWSSLPAEERLAIMAELDGRKGQLRASANRPSARKRARQTSRD